MKKARQKTYQGKTAGGWLRNAIICTMRAGDYAVYVGSYYLLQATNGDMVMQYYGDTVVTLICSSRAAKKLRDLIKSADDKTLAEI